MNHYAPRRSVIVRGCLVGGMAFQMVSCHPASHQLSVQTRTLRVGPVALSEHAGHHAMIHSTTDEVFAPEHPKQEILIDREGWVVGVVPRAVNAHGQALPGQLLHHVLLVNRGSAHHRPEGAATMHWGIGTGGDLTAFRFPKGYGLLVRAQDRLELTCMFDNPFHVAYKGVCCEAAVTLQYHQAGVPDLKSLATYWFKVDPGVGYGYQVPPGRHERAASFQFPFTGTVVFMVAHLHAHAHALKLEEVGSQRTVWTTAPQQTTDGQLQFIPTWSSPKGWHVTPRETYRLTAIYNNPLTTPIDAMGVLGVFAYPDAAP